MENSFSALINQASSSESKLDVNFDTVRAFVKKTPNLEKLKTEVLIPRITAMCNTNWSDKMKKSFTVSMIDSIMAGLNETMVNQNAEVDKLVALLIDLKIEGFIDGWNSHIDAYSR